MNGLALSMTLAAVTLAQTPEQAPDGEKKAEFEVASVKPTATQDGSLSVHFPPGGRFSIRNLTLKQLLQTAYAVQAYQISGGPGWITSAGFDIEARAGAGTVDLPREQVLRMVQTLLTDRFQLSLHRETRQLPVYALIVGKTGSRLQPADTDVGPPQTRMGQMLVRKMSMTHLANILALALQRPVKDETGLKGEFAFALEWTPGLSDTDDRPSPRPSLFTAVQEQLGLKLESVKGPIEVLVIDRAEKPSGN